MYADSYIYPRYALFGNGVDAWEIDILHGKAFSKGLRAVENVITFTAQREIEIYKKSKSKEPRNMSVVESYGRAQQRALKEISRLKAEDPIQKIL